MDYVNYIVEETEKLLSIPGPSGYTFECANYVLRTLQNMGYDPELTRKGAVLVNLGGKKKDGNGIVVAAHIDTLGAMVAEIKANGRLRLTNIGGMNPNNAETENCMVITRSGERYEATFQLVNASIHVNGAYNETVRSYDTMEAVLDENVSSREEVERLGIMNGDIVCFEPRTRVTSKGYIKSRFLDDKLSAAILLGYARYLKEENCDPGRNVYLLFTTYEEVGHGGAMMMPEDVSEVLSVDMGCVGEGLLCDETMVSICAKDRMGPYDYDSVSNLIRTAKENGLSFAVDVYPHYGSDADVTLRAGNDLKHGLIGPGVYASHGYERSHVDGVKNTFDLLKYYLA